MPKRDAVLPSLFSFTRRLAERLRDDPPTAENPWALITLGDLTLDVFRLLQVAEKAQEYVTKLDDEGMADDDALREALSRVL